MRNRTILFTTLLAVTIFFSCGNISDKKIRIAYANWAEGIAVTYLAKEILSEQGYRTELLNADIAPIFKSSVLYPCSERIQDRTFECGHRPHIHLSGKRQD